MGEGDDIRTRVTEQMKAAMKSGDTKRRDVLRMLLAEMKNVELAGEADDPQAVAAYAKRLAKGVEEMTSAGADDRAADMQAELDIVGEFLPRQLSDEELEALIDQIIAGGNYGPKDIGQVMRELMSAHRNEVDGRKANQIVRAKLQGN